MRKIAISLATLLVAALAACAESPTSSAAGAEASLNGVYAGSGHDEEENADAAAALDEASALSAVERGPGLAGSGH